MELGIFLIIGILSFVASFYIKSIKIKLIIAAVLFLLCFIMFIITIYIIGGYSGIVAVLAAKFFTTVIVAMLLNIIFTLIYKIR